MSVRVMEGDCRAVLRGLDAESVQCCVTSPPYWGLRDYGTATWEGGEATCDHMGMPFRTKANINRNCGTGIDGKNAEGREFFREECGKCGARRVDAQLGLEKTPEEYVANMVSVFREVRRVLRDDATLWLNLGDSYAGGTTGRNDADRPHAAGQERGRYDVGADQVYRNKQRPVPYGLKPKDLVGIPWRVAFALQADGWYLRSDIIWHKPNPMPESVTDRPTKAHEYLFLLTKSERYYYDADAVREPFSPHTLVAYPNGPGGGVKPDVVAHMQSRGSGGHVDDIGASYIDNGKRNRRSVWTVATQPYSGAHFATFPPALIEPCVMAGSKKGDTVLDPFGGAGTTGLVADRLGRDAILVELNPEYAAMARTRIHSDNPLFTEVA